MHIERGERVEEVHKELWVTEVYDTPGFNDKDDLDPLYQAAIEDCICSVQRANALIMAINVQPRMTNSASLSLGVYKQLFGDSIASILMVVLTVNEPADQKTLENRIKLNWPTISRWDRRIERRNTFCVSLHDLRVKEHSASHDVVNEIASVCRAMSPLLIESLASRYREARDALVNKLNNAHEELQKVVDDGWQAYERLTNEFEQSPYVKMVDEDDGLLNGFVMKNVKIPRNFIERIFVGIDNVVRKVAIHLKTDSDLAVTIWEEFLKGHSHERNCSDLMRKFGDSLWNAGLAVIVHDMDVYYKGTLRVKPYKVFIFKPVSYSFEDVVSYLNEVLTKPGEELRPDVVEQLYKSIVPVVRRSSTFFRGKRSRKRPQSDTSA